MNPTDEVGQTLEELFMQIVLILVLFAIMVAVCMLGGFVLSALLGGILLRFPRANLIAPIFLVVVPTTIAGAITGGIGLGYAAYNLNESALFLGPLGACSLAVWPDF